MTRGSPVGDWDGWREKVARYWAARKISPEAAFWVRVGVGNSDACWPWLGSSVGWYGQLRWRKELVLAHRVAWEITHGDIPDGLWVLHRCDNPPCCNPAHLFLGTHSDNMKDMAAKGRSGLQRPYIRPVGDQHYARQHPERLARGEHHGMAKLTMAQAREIRARYTPTRGVQKMLAEEYGVHRSTISHIVKGIVWKEIGLVELAGPNVDPR